MMDVDHSSIPSYVTGWLASAVTGLLGLLVSTWVWLFKRSDNRTKAVEEGLVKLREHTQQESAKVQLQIVELASRKDLIAHMSQIREDLNEREKRAREDSNIRHIENRAWLEKLTESVNQIRSDNREDISALRDNVREDISAIHDRIESLK